MKKFRKSISAVLAVLMVLCAFTSLSFGASAAEANTITVTSNLCDSQTYSYDSDSTQFTVTYFLQSDKMILDTEATLSYDNTVLKFASTNTPTSVAPVLSTGNFVVNTEKTGVLKFNSNSLGLFDFKDGGVYFTATFDIVGTGSTEVNLDVDIITATTAKTADSIETGTDIDFVYYDSIMTGSFAFSAEGNVVSGADGTTLYFAAPVFKEGSSWDEVYLAYSADSNVSKATRLPMVKTNNMYYASGELAGSLSTNTNWAVYKISLTDEQVAAIDAANYAGFTNNIKSATSIRTNYIYANSVFRANIDATGYKGTKTSVSDLSGKMFVISGATSLANKTSFTGNWVSSTGSGVISTIYAASPVVSDTTSMGDVYFRYGSTSSVSAATQIRMMKTDYLYTNNTSASNLKTGDWTIYKLDVTAKQAAEIDAANYTGFTSSYGAEVRTYFSYANSVTRAKVGSYSTTYNASSTSVTDLDGKLFAIQGSVASNTTSYLGYWSDYNGIIRTVTFKVAVPSTIQNKAVTSLDFVYSDEYDVATATHVAMTKTSETFTPDAVYTTLLNSSTKWSVYEVTVDANQINDITNCYRVGFVANDQVLKTNYAWSGNVLRAGIGAYDEPYDTTTTASLDDLDGATFVVCGATSDKATLMTGYWKVA